MMIDTTSQSSRSTNPSRDRASSMDSSDFTFDLPQAIYKPLKIGLLSRKTKLEEILELLRMPHEDFIWYTDVQKLSRKTRDDKPYYLVLATNCFIMIRIADNKIRSYPYQDVESLRPWITPQKEHGFKLRFYRKDGNLKNPQKEMTMACKDADSYFSATHVIQRQMPLNWQQFFEKHIEIQEDDCYQFHAYLLKQNRFGSAQARFIVLTTRWVINAKAAFDKISGNIKFEKMKWKIPASSLTKVKIEKQADKFNIKIFTDLEKQNQVLVENGLKKIKKAERKFQFSDITPCRDFIFHLKRIHHLHNCLGPYSTTPPLEVEAPPFPEEKK